MGEVHKVGDNISGQHPSVFELVLNDHIRYVDPKDYGLDQQYSLDPSSYFITSGDAVEKAKILERDIWLLVNKLRKELQQGDENFSAYTAEILITAKQATNLHQALKVAKGTNCFLETEWENHRLLCIPKNPRARE
jgi:hypothetical protein